jgi:hypothetical protein
MLAFCIDKSSWIERLSAMIRPTAVVLVRIFAVKECLVDHGVTARVVQLRL